MKNFFLISITIISFSFISCKKENENKIAPPLSLLSAIKEIRNLPDDSLTVEYKFDTDEITVLEEKYINFSIKGFKETLAAPRVTSSWLTYRLYTFDALDHLVKYTEFSSVSPGKPSRLDSNIYENNRLIKKVSKSFWLNADGIVTFNYPLWLTKRQYDYDSQNRIITETDSVFITHDIAKGTVVVIQAEPRFVYTNTTHNNYNDKSELTERKTVSTKDNLLTYSNGWNAFGATHPGKVYNGTTTFSYTYDKSNRLIIKKCFFKDSRTGKVYESSFTYSYAEYVF